MSRCAGCEVKSQQVRLLDIFAIGPLMMWGGVALDRQGHDVAGPALALLGFTTIIYNWHNYDVVRRRNDAAR